VQASRPSRELADDRRADRVARLSARPLRPSRFLYSITSGRSRDTDWLPGRVCRRRPAWVVASDAPEAAARGAHADARRPPGSRARAPAEARPARAGDDPLPPRAPAAPVRERRPGAAHRGSPRGRGGDDRWRGAERRRAAAREAADP